MGSRLQIPVMVSLINHTACDATDFPAYSNSGYSDTPVIGTVLTGPKWPFIYKDGVVRVTLAYSDTFLLSRGCHCKRGRL